MKCITTNITYVRYLFVYFLFLVACKGGETTSDVADIIIVDSVVAKLNVPIIKSDSPYCKLSIKDLTWNGFPFYQNIEIDEFPELDSTAVHFNEVLEGNVRHFYYKSDTIRVFRNQIVGANIYSGTFGIKGNLVVIGDSFQKFLDYSGCSDKITDGIFSTYFVDFDFSIEITVSKSLITGFSTWTPT